MFDVSVVVEFDGYLLPDFLRREIRNATHTLSESLLRYVIVNLTVCTIHKKDILPHHNNIIIVLQVLVFNKFDNNVFVHTMSNVCAMQCQYLKLYEMGLLEQ